MNTTERLAFRLVIAEPNTTERTITVCPRYDGLKLKWSRPSGQMYYTEDISGTLKFLGVDFQTINACALNTQFTLIVYQNRVEVGRSIFKKTDCKWDIDHGVVEVDVSVYDKYKKFQDKKDEEYNLVRMGLSKKRLDFNVYPSSELYVQGDNHLYAFMYDGVPTEVDVANPTTDVATLTTQFGPANLPITASAYIESGTYAGKYIGVSDYPQQDGTALTYVLIRTDGAYSIAIHGVYGIVGANRKSWNYSIVNNNTHTAVVTTEYIDHGEANERYPCFVSRTQIYFGVGYPVATLRCWVTWGRLVSQMNIGIEIENNIRGDVGKRYCYGKYCFIRISSNESSTGDYHIEGSNMFYDKPDTTHEWVPVYMESWYRGISLWCSSTETRSIGGVTYMNTPTSTENSLHCVSSFCNDFYLLTDAIRAVAQKIDEDIQFDSLDSQFLFNSINPLNGIQQGALYISQKSNILNLGYDYPAWLAPVKWSQIETLLREAFDCYWSLYVRDGHEHLRIEHRRWYELGGTYTQPGVQVATIDLTSTYRNGTPFTFGEKTRHWEFDTDGNGTVSTASRHEYGWMDTQSEIFDGQPITVPEAYRLFTDEKVEQHKVDWFSSDIDFLTSVQAECSSDGFVVVMENPNRPNWIVTGASEYSGQNYQLSFDYLQDKYLLQGIYAEVVMIGDNETLTNSNARMRTSEVQLRAPAGMSIEASDTIKTAVGIGVIDTLEYDLHSQLYTVKLRYENE